MSTTPDTSRTTLTNAVQERLDTHLDTLLDTDAIPFYSRVSGRVVADGDGRYWLVETTVSVSRFYEDRYGSAA